MDFKDEKEIQEFTNYLDDYKRQPEPEESDDLAPTEEENESFTPVSPRFEVRGDEPYHGPALEEVQTVDELNALTKHEAKAEIRRELRDQEANANISASVQHARKSFRDFDD